MPRVVVVGVRDPSRDTAAKNDLAAREATTAVDLVSRDLATGDDLTVGEGRGKSPAFFFYGLS